jgi:putative restriction endonuclease
MPEIYVGNTDNRWFDFLRRRAPWEEVNFWKPTPATFKAIDEGGIFAFRLKSPRALIGGYGILASAINVPIQFAWDGLGQANGCSTVSELVDAITKYRDGKDITAQSLFGCRVLVDPVFFPEDQWFPVPRDWSDNIVSGKTYSTRSDLGRELYERLMERTGVSVHYERDRSGAFGFGSTAQKPLLGPMPDGGRFGQPFQVLPRLGQQSFRIKVASLYNFSCALSDTKVLPALDAAHLKPYNIGGLHVPQNGIFLRKDIHSVFDAGYATFDKDFRFVVSERVRTDFNNGNEYRRLHGTRLKLPIAQMHWPSHENLEWHRIERYRD